MYFSSLTADNAPVGLTDTCTNEVMIILHAPESWVNLYRSKPSFPVKTPFSYTCENKESDTW